MSNKFVLKFTLFNNDYLSSSEKKAEWFEEIISRIQEFDLFIKNYFFNY